MKSREANLVLLKGNLESLGFGCLEIGHLMAKLELKTLFEAMVQIFDRKEAVMLKNRLITTEKAGLRTKTPVRREKSPDMFQIS